MSTCRGHADLTPGCTECALEDACTEVSRLNALDKQRCEEIQRLHRLLAQSEADWTAFRQEHDKAKAEVARLRKDPLPALAMMRDIERTVAEKQREACAKVAYLYADLNYDSDTVEAKVRATPLVTEEKP